MTMPADLALDVSDAAGEPATQAAWLFLPGEPADTRAVVDPGHRGHGVPIDKQR